MLPPQLVDAVVEAKLHNDHHTETIGQLALAELITGHGYDRHIRAGRQRYRRRREQLLDTLAALSCPALAAPGIAAGLHALVPLPADGPTEREILERATALRLRLGYLGDHWHQPAADRPQGVIIGYATPTESAYPATLRTLARVLGG